MPYIPKKQPRRSYIPKPKKTFGNKDYSFYNSKTWRKCSVTYRKHLAVTNNGKCEVCEKNLAEMVDHLIRIEAGGKRYDQLNLAGMCHRCHNIKRGLESGDYNPPSRKGIPVDRQQIFNDIKERL